MDRAKDERDILLVEDNPDDIELTMRAFKKSMVSNKVVVARDGVEALDYLFRSGMHKGRNPGRNPSLVLLDLKLPRVDGLEVLKRMRNDDRTRTVPVVILTSSREETDVLNGYSSGANSYVRKPISFEEFVKTVADLAQYWLSVNEPAPDARGD
jgi:two-component system response regulator